MLSLCVYFKIFGLLWFGLLDKLLSLSLRMPSYLDYMIHPSLLRFLQIHNMEVLKLLCLLFYIVVFIFKFIIIRNFENVIFDKFLKFNLFE